MKSSLRSLLAVPLAKKSENLLISDGIGLGPAKRELRHTTVLKVLGCL